jgi:hypothetical protein
MNWRRESAKGEVIIVRYADEFVLGFQPRQEADRFRKQLRERMVAYGLELHPEKTRRIQFGRVAAEDRKRDGAGKPETFHFLGFTQVGVPLTQLPIHQVPLVAPDVLSRCKIWWSAESRGYPTSRIAAARFGKAASLRWCARR